MLYSTCSLEREENEDVVNEVISGTKAYQVLDCSKELQSLRESGRLAWADIASLTRGPFLHTTPGIHPCDGFFAALIERI